MKLESDFDPIPGLPLLTDLFCNVTKVKRKKVIDCKFPDILYTKKMIYGGLPAIGIGLSEIMIILALIFISIKMKNDISKQFLTALVIPLGFSALFKVLMGIYGTLLGPYGYLFVTIQHLYGFTYTSGVLTAAMGSVFFLAGLICVARSRSTFDNGQAWISFNSILFASCLISGSYHFISQKWNQLPAAAIFFYLVIATIAIVVLLITTLIILLACKKPYTQSANDAPNVANARDHLGWGALFVLILNIPAWFEIFYKSVEMFTPFLWGGPAHKKKFYRAQRIELLTYDIVQIAFTQVMLIAFFLNASSRVALIAWKNHQFMKKDNKKVFIASQKAPLLMNNGEKNEKEPLDDIPSSNAIAPSPSAPATSIQMPPNLGMQINQPPPPPQYAGINFAPGMVQFPQNMQTTIVYTPPNMATNGVIVEELK
ncbi:unnamed protein product [Caenorhabditis bovis]|uniref:Uncharacterized protein n=1 Tax=Caenorhabditis bovis TaxID=2654633 RepID=A0A8S1E5B5_9PELO|nr:unnamed protein product [Caenorhabditis bovis]